MNQVTSAALAETVLVSYRAIKAGSSVAPQKSGTAPGVVVAGTATKSPYKMPLPSEYTSVVIVFGALHFLEPAQPRVAGLIAWGLVLATLLNLWQPSSTSATGLGASSKK